MANVIRHKRGTSNPVAGDFSETAELLVNTTDGGLFTKTDGGSVVEIGGDVAFNDLTGKTSGTGDYSTNGDFVSGRGSGGVALTINDGYGNANVTWNHQNGRPEQNGNAARIEVNTDASTNAQMYFELKSGVTANTNVSLTNILTLSEGAVSALKPLSVTGNITVSGTVDGRDVAADGTKLDGIESGATADQTASEILTAIKTVDGSGSGLDADTVDGIQSTGIVYGTAGAAVNALSTTQNVYELGQYKAGFWDINGASWTPNTGWWWGATFAHRSNTGSYNYSGQLAFENGNGGNGIYARTISNGTASSWSKLWSDGNDGSGSGLDADTLDGQQGSYYAPIANPTFTGTVTYDALASSSSLARHYSTYYSGTSYLVSGEYQKVVTIIPNGSSQNYQIIGRMIAQSGGTAQTINFNALLRSNTLPDLSWTISYTEELMGAGQYITPQLWTKETTTAGFVLAFEVNATIYGNVTCEFLVIPRNSSQHSNVTVNTDSTSEQSSVDTGYTANNFSLNTSLNGVNITYNGNISFEGSTADAYETTLTAADPTADRTITLPNATGTVWTSGNDGSGSGLDADTVDGVHASSFFQANNALSATTGAFSGDVTMSGTGALKVANGTTAQRPTAATGQIRYNTTLGAIESYVQGAWQVIANTALDYGLITSASDTTFDYGALS